MTQRRPLVTFDGRVRELPAGDTLADATLGTELTGLSQLGTTGIMVRTGAGTYATRTITGTTNQVNVSNGDGVLGNPTLSTPQNIHTGASPTFAGITLSGMTSGSVLFAGTGGVVSQDNAGLFYDDAANTLRVGAASTTASGGLIQLATGTTAASGILWGTDTNLYRSAANTLKTDDSFTVSGHLSANSTARFEDYVYGQTASGKLYINSDIALAAAKKLYLDTGSNTYVSEISADTINIVTGGSEIMRITQAGNILIGTTTETASNGRLQFATATTAAGGILFGTDTNLYRSAANTLKTDDALTIADTTASTSSTTGALIVSGGAGIAKDSFINSVRIGRGTSSIAHNIAIGEGSPLGAITTGDRNIAIGSGALGAVTTTVANTAVGFAAGNAFTGQKGIFIGAYAGYGRTSGDDNIVIGGGVGTTATGAGNVILGIGSGQGLTSGAYNLTMGSSAGANITTGSSNVLIGESAGYFLTQGYQNVAIGAGAATGWYSAGAALTTGIQNTYIGAGAGRTNSTGNYNVAIGNIAGFLSTTSNNIFIGNMAGRYATTESSELFIDNQNRSNRAGDVAGAIIYGVMNSTPANQTLALNAQVSLGSPEQVRVTNTASANRYITLTGSNGGSPTIGTSGGNLAVSSSTDITGALTVSGNLVISAGAVYSNERLTVRATAAAHHTAAVWQASSNTLHTYLYSDGNVAGHTLTSTSGGAIYMHHLARDAHRFMNNSGEELVRITNTAGATRYMTLTGSNGGNPTIGTSAGSLAITSASGATYFNASSGNTDGTIYIRPTGTGVYSSVQFRSATDTGTAQLICDSGTALYLDSAAGNYTRIRSGGYTHVRVGATASANRYLIFDGSNGGNPTIDVSAGSLAITPATVFASTISAGVATLDGVIIRGTSLALTNSFTIGPSASVNGINSLAIGSNCSAVGDSSTAIGRNANTTAGGGTSLGVSASAGSEAVAIGVDTVAGSLCTSIGKGANTTSNSIAIGKGATTGVTASIAIGINATTQSTKSIVIGSPSAGLEILDSYFGTGEFTAVPYSHTIHASGGLGTDIAGANLGLAGGRPTGAGAGGYIFFSTAVAGLSSSTIRNLVERMRITSPGNVLINTTTDDTVNKLQVAGTISVIGGATLITTSTALTDGAGAGAGTLTNAPAAGDPTKWIGINDNGTTRYIPAW